MHVMDISSMHILVTVSTQTIFNTYWIKHVLVILHLQLFAD